MMGYKLQWVRQTSEGVWATDVVELWDYDMIGNRAWYILVYREPEH